MYLKAIYSVFIGILIAAFVGLGIDAFYPSPTPPEYPIELRKPEAEITDEESDRDYQKLEEYEASFDEYQMISETYNRNVSIIAIISSVIILVVSLTSVNKILIIADGLLLGGILTLSYGIIRGFASGDPLYRFITVSLGLIISLILGYMKFIKPNKK